VVLGAGPAWAVEPPLPPQELERRSDLVTEVRVLDVVCTGYVPYGPKREGVRAAKYQAWLQILRVKKGKVGVGETVIVQWTEPEALRTGDWIVAYYPGEEVLAHLVWSPDERVYSTTSWNAKSVLRGPTKGTELPKQCP